MQQAELDNLHNMKTPQNPDTHTFSNISLSAAE